MKIYRETDLLKHIDASLERYPHLWKLEDGELINAKHQVKANCFEINAVTHDGFHFSKNIKSEYAEFKRLCRKYEKYLSSCEKQIKKQYFPLDLYFAVAEDIENNVDDWIGQTISLIHNEKLSTTITFKYKLFSNNSTINNLIITNSQATYLSWTYEKAVKNAERRKKIELRTIDQQKSLTLREKLLPK